MTPYFTLTTQDLQGTAPEGTMNARDEAERQAARLAALLAKKNVKIVFAESCTAGLVPALLAATPGISRFLCGSFVTYREPSKTAWLDVSAELLSQHTAVHPVTTRTMAEAALRRTAEADLAAAITGHLGPDAPSELDGTVYISIVTRRAPHDASPHEVAVPLQSTVRVDRQFEAASHLLREASACLQRWY